MSESKLWVPFRLLRKRNQSYRDANNTISLAANHGALGLRPLYDTKCSRITCRRFQMDGALWKRPSALIPLAMSVAALATALGYAAMFGTARQVDEGAA